MVGGKERVGGKGGGGGGGAPASVPRPVNLCFVPRESQRDSARESSVLPPLEQDESGCTGRAAAIFAGPGFELPTKKSAVGCMTVRPLLTLGAVVPPTTWSQVCH